jgi:hypothetical protein
MSAKEQMEKVKRLNAEKASAAKKKTVAPKKIETPLSKAAAKKEKGPRVSASAMCRELLRKGTMTDEAISIEVTKVFSEFSGVPRVVHIRSCLVKEGETITRVESSATKKAATPAPATKRAAPAVKKLTITKSVVKKLTRK